MEAPKSALETAMERMKARAAPPPKTVKRTLVFVADPGHGWLEVPNEDIKALGIARRISSYSYMTTRASFLEEDLDYGVFMEAAKAKGWDIKTKTRHVDRPAPLRNYSSYKPEWIEFPFVVGTATRLNNGSIVTVAAINGSRVELATESGRVAYKSHTATVLACVVSDEAWRKKLDGMRRFDAGPTR